MNASANTVEMSDLLQLTVDEGASDLHIRVGLPPVLRIHGALSPLDLPALTPEDTERLMKSITSAEHQQNVRENGGTDFGFSFGEDSPSRLTVCLFYSSIKTNNYVCIIYFYASLC